MGYPAGQVDPVQLAQVASRAERAVSAFAVPAEPLAGEPTLRGWAAGASLGRAGQAWTEFLNCLGGQVRGFAAGLADAAREYQAVDAAAADRIVVAGGRRFE